VPRSKALRHFERAAASFFVVPSFPLRLSPLLLPCLRFFCRLFVFVFSYWRCMLEAGAVITAWVIDDDELNINPPTLMMN
jgi:hypothetical protein